MRRIAWIRLVAGTLLLVSIGCETHRAWTRSQDGEASGARSSDAKAVPSDASKILGVDSDDNSREPFFKNTRRSGALSSEGREIERDLGVP
jgi:hypothetical protein